MSTKGVGRCMALLGLIVGVVFAAGLRSASAVDGPVFATPSVGNTAAPQGQKWPITMTGASLPLAMGCGAEKRVLWYGAGAAADVLWRNIAFPVSGASTHTTTAVSMGGSFTPFTGDFDGDGCEDVFWYPAAGGTGAVWYFAANGTHTSKAVALAPAATPLVGRFNSDRRDDIYWYVPGAGRESIWLGAADRSFRAAVAPQMSGLFAPVIAVDASSILWYRAGSASDLLWRGVKADATKPTSTAMLTVNGSYALRNFGGSALLYAPGASADLLITGVSPAPVKLRTLSGRLDATYVITNSTVKAGFGVLSVTGTGQDYLVKPRAVVASPPTTTTSTTSTTTTTTAPLDSDGDGIPDSIDPCPNVANPGNGPCPYTVYELRNGTVAAGANVSVSNLLVTFVKGDASRAWAQVKLGDASYNLNGPQHSGLEIDLSQVLTVIGAGDRIDVAGTLAADGTVTANSLTIVSALNESLPAAVDIGTDASIASVGSYDDVLVKAGPAQVDATTANSFSLGFRIPLVVENSLASLTIPAVGAQISSVVGILRVDALGTALRPRSDVDIVVASPPVMGNGLVEAGEQCDDGNLSSGDGCSNVGTIESGYVCSGSPSVCLANSLATVPLTKQRRS